MGTGDKRMSPTGNNCRPPKCPGESKAPNGAQAVSGYGTTEKCKAQFQWPPGMQSQWRERPGQQRV